MPIALIGDEAYWVLRGTTRAGYRGKWTYLDRETAEEAMRMLIRDRLLTNLVVHRKRQVPAVYATSDPMWWQTDELSQPSGMAFTPDWDPPTGKLPK